MLLQNATDFGDARHIRVPAWEIERWGSVGAGDERNVQVHFCRYSRKRYPPVVRLELRT